MKMFFGKHALQLSEHNEFSLPSESWKELKGIVYLTPGFDRNLYLLPQQTFEAIYSHIKDVSISDPLARTLSRLFLSGAEEITLDQHRQIKLPGNLCEYARLGKDIVIVGQGEYLEIWSQDLWQKQTESMNDFDENPHRFERFQISTT
jgi:MraZ protein